MIQAVSLFSGAGGLDLGLNRDKVELVSCLEIDEDCCSTLKKNKKKYFGETHILEMDITDVVKDSSNELLKNIDKKKKVIVIGGPPCQPFSKNGYWITNKKRLKDLDPRNHISSFLKIVKQIDADAFLLENVESILHPTNVHVAEQIEEITLQMGYEPKMYKANACEFGVPQKRKRVFFFGTRGEFEAKEPLRTNISHSKKGNLDLFHNLPDFLGVGEFLKNFENEKYFEKEEVCKKGRYFQELKRVPAGKNYLALTEKAGCKDPKFEYGTKFWNFLLKLHPELPSWTIAASPGPWVGPFHWDNRRLRTPEIAAIQTFPKDYRFTGNRRSKQKQIGNAVPPLLAEAMLDFLISSIR